MLPTLKEIARIANISPKIVAKVLNNDKDIDPEIKKKVLDLINKYDSNQDMKEIEVVTPRSRTFGFIVTNIENPFFGQMVNYFQREIDLTNNNLLICVSNDTAQKEKAAVELLISKGVAGIFIIPSRDGQYDLSHFEKLRQKKIPVVFVTSAYLGIEADSVMTDYEVATYELTKSLLSQGKHKIFFITELRSLLISSERYMGYIRAYNEMKVEYDDEWIFEIIPNSRNGYILTNEILKGDWPDAIITINQQLAVGVLECLRHNNIQVPDQITMATFDELIYSSVLCSPITTIKQPIKKIAIKSIELMFKRVNGSREKIRTELLLGEMIDRLSPN